MSVTLQPSCVHCVEEREVSERERDWNPAAAGGVAAGHGLAKAVGGAVAHHGGSDGRDVVGGGCTPLLARAPATNDRPWLIHGGFTRQVQPTPTSCCCCCCRCRPVVVLSCCLSPTCRVIIRGTLGARVSAILAFAAICADCLFVLTAVLSGGLRGVLCGRGEGVRL